MKPRSILLALACSIFIGNTSCIDNNKKTDNKAVQTAFEKQYPKVSDIDWKLKDSFYVVEFKQIGIKEAEAWYDKEGKWLQSEFDIKFDKLPQIVQEAFGKTKYATWKIDDIKILERLNMDNLCIIEVENKANNAEMTLFYTDSGLLIKEEPELDNQYITPFIIPDSISVFIQDKFPNAKIVETERVYDNLEIDIIYDKQPIEILFNKDNQWLYSQWNISFDQLPDTVATEFRNTDYANYKIDEIKYRTQPNTIAQYLFELENNHGVEVNLTINEEGTIVNK